MNFLFLKYSSYITSIDKMLKRLKEYNKEDAMTVVRNWGYIVDTKRTKTIKKANPKNNKYGIYDVVYYHKKKDYLNKIRRGVI